VAIYQTPLLNLVLRERWIQGTLCYTADDYRAVIDLMASGHYDTTGWVETIPSTTSSKTDISHCAPERR
jgi:(R,R)-butanediol dehydrogenase/meso-butanediol dehydrogenase/diacetyl reductase